VRKVVYESQRQGKSDEMEKIFKQKMNKEQNMYGQEIGCGCLVNVSVCVQGVCVCLYTTEKQGECVAGAV
jgi:hypothetical protein